MKKKVFSLMMTLLLAFMGVARADELTVNDGEATNAYVPVYGFYADAYLKCEFVQPAADLADMNGATINGLTFYASNSSVSWGNAMFEVFLTEVGSTTLNNFVGDGTIVYQGAMSIVNGEMSVTFSTPYTYNGGNLLVGVYNIAEGSYVSCSWYGVSADGASVQGYSYSDLSSISASQRNFLPKMTFDYTPAGGQGGETVEVTIGDPTATTTNAYLPGYTLYDYAISQQIYTADEIGVGGTINTLTMWLKNSSSYARNINVYMKEVSESTFASNTSWVSMTADDMVASFTMNNGITEPVEMAIDLSTPFDYSGNDNLVICFQDVTGSWSSGLAGVVMDANGNQAIYAYRDGTPYDVAAPGVNGTLLTTKNVVRLSITTGGGESGEPIAYDFESGMQGWTSIDNDGDGNGWFHSSLSETYSGYDYTGLGHNDSDGFAISQSYTDYDGAVDADNYLVSPQKYTMVGNSSINFFFDYANDNYPDFFEVCVATVDNPTASDFTAIWDVDLRSNAAKTQVRHNNDRYENWREVTVDLSAYAGQDVWIAFHHQDYDEYEVWIDDVTVIAAVPEVNYIDIVEINDFEAPVWGQQVTQNVTIPEDANYSLLVAAWFSYPHGMLPPAREMNPDPIYNLSDSDYVWGFNLVPNEGYAFSPALEAYINGSADNVLLAIIVTPDMAQEFPEFPAGSVVIYTYAYYTYEEGLHTLSTYGVGDNAYESVDRLLIERPNGAWMEPYHFQLYNDGTEDVEVVLIDFLHNNGYFSMAEGTEYPFTVAATGRPGVDLYINTNTDWTDTEELNSLLAVNTSERSTHLYQIVAAPYQPYCPDVVETAYELGTVNDGFTWSEYMSEIWDGPAEMELHANYDLPDYEENIPDGYDAVMKFTVDHPMNLNARVVEGYENGKVALYRADFDGEGGPMATNNYTGRPMSGSGGGATGGSFEAVIGNVESNTTSGYVPFYTLYNYSISESLYLASELTAASITTAPMTSLSWYATNAPGYEQQGISIWMANVSDAALTSTSHTVSGMTLVYTGSMTPQIGWNEFAFNQGSFAWDGQSNVLILVQRNNGTWNSTVYWTNENVGFAATTYEYQDSGAYNVNTPNSVYTSNNRPVITMKGGNRMVTDRVKRGDRATATVNPHLIATRSGQQNRSGMTDWRNAFRGSTAYGICVYNDGSLDYGINQFDIDNLAGATVINSYDGIGGMVYNPNNSHFYVSDYSNSMLYEVDADGNVLNTVGTDYAIVSLAWDQTTNTLYSMDSYSWLNITDPTTGEMTDIDALSNTDVMCITANANGQLFGVLYGDTSALVSIDKTDATVTTICTLNAGCNYAQSMAFDMNDNKLYWAQCYDDSNLYEINPTTGALTLKAANTSEICGLCIPAVATPTPVDPDQPVVGEFHYWSAGPVITDLNVLPGTYYLVASSTEEDFEVEFGISELPCPEKALVASPVDNASNLDPEGIVLRWALSPDCVQYRLVFGSTYWPDDEPNHPQTIITNWSSDLAESYALPDLWNNTNYFWRIDQRTGLSDENPGCVTTGDVWGFTTHLRAPQNLRANDETIFEDEPLTLTWNPIVDRTYRRYRIYMDGELYYQTQPNPDPTAQTSYTIPGGTLEYNMDGYNFYVTAVYDEGESAPSNEVNVKVSGYSNATGINGYAYEQDGTTPIGGVTVTIEGTDEFGVPHTYTTTTGTNGYYHQVVYAGNYTMAVATMDGYQETVTNHTLPFTVVYNGQVDNVNFIMDELFVAPAHVCAQTTYVEGVEGDSLVQVWWDFNFCAGDYEAQIGNGTTTTGYMPFYTLYNNSLATALYRAEELVAAGVTTAPMTSLSWYASNTTGYNQQGITIWMANVNDNTVSTTSPLTAGMTKVYTGAMTPVVGWNEFVFNEGDFEWDGESNIIIVVQRLNGEWNSTVYWNGSNAGFNAMSYDYDDYEVYNAETNTYSMSTSSTRPNIIMKGNCDRGGEDLTRSLHHYNIYRTDCYNDGPYNSDNTVFLASAWRPDTSYFDVQWPQVPVGVYKYGVSAVYAGNYDGNPNNPRVDYPFEPRESEIVWHNMCSPCIDKDMYLENEVTVNVVLNSADSPEGVQVSFENLNPGEQVNHPQAGVTLDQTGYYVFPRFRKGDYLVTVGLPGYETIQVTESIWEPTDLRYVLIEIICKVQNLYVSRTGWAMWDPQAPCPGGVEPGPTPGPGGDATSFTEGFEGGLNGWNVLTVNADGGSWIHSDNNLGGYDYTTHAHGGTGFAMCYSFVDYDGAYDTDSYLYTPQKYDIVNGSTLTFWADNANDSYPESFSVCVSTADTPTASSFTQVWSGAAKANGNAKANVRHDANRYDNWRSHSVDLSAYAGQSVYIAFHDVNYDMYEVWIDDVALTTGRAVAEERHLEGYKIMCTSIDGEPIFNHNTVAEQPFCQLATDQLVEGETYICKVAAIYSTGMSEYEEVAWQYGSCESYAGTVNGLAVEGSTISWDYPGGQPGPGPEPGQGSSFNVDFEGGLPEGWTTIDGNNDGYTWTATSAIPTTWTYYAGMTLDWYHSGTDAMCSGSYINGVGAITPNDYLVSPLVTLVNGSQLSFWVAATDASYPADHFGVFVSDDANTWTSVQEWTLTGKKSGVFGPWSQAAPKATAVAGDRASRDGEGLRIGTWYNYTVDLSAYAGQKYVAFRHFNCNDQYIMCLDDVTLTAGAKAGNRDYLQYSTEEFDGGVGTGGGAVYWGIRFPAADLAAYVGQNLTKVGIFTDVDGDYGWTYSGNYTVNVYLGGTTAPGTLVSTAQEYVPGDLAWHDITLTTPVAIDGTQDLWLTFYTADIAYPMSGCTYVGNSNSDFLSLDGVTWEHSTDYALDYTWMIRGTVEGGVTPPPTPVDGILGAMIFVDGEWEAFVEAPTNSYTYEGDGEEICVRIVYDGVAEMPANNLYYAMSCEECIGGLEPVCEPGAPIYGEVTADDQVRVYWDNEPGPQPDEGDTFVYDFENGSLDGLLLIDNDGDGYNWLANTSFGGHNGSTGIIYSQSYDNNFGALTPDNYIVFPQSNIANGSTFSFWACGQDASWASEHFGVAVSTTGTNASDFTTIAEWTMTAKGTKAVRDGRDQGNWYNYTVDLSDYAGMPVYIAIRHFNSTDMFYLDVDDVELGIANKGNRDGIIGYNIYRSEDNVDYALIASVPGTATEYIDNPGEGTFYYQVTAVYANCESEPAISGENPDVNYVMVGRTGIGENSANVNLFPNPTKGNVTIQAMNMHRITVVSVLGQVVFDTELDQDEYILNMAQFNTGMYMVRVYTDEGVTVKRVTVLH